MNCEANGCTAALERKSLPGSAMGGPSPWVVTDIPAGWCVRFVENVDIGSGRLVVLCRIHGAGIVQSEESLYTGAEFLATADALNLSDALGRLGLALDVARRFGGIDGDHHKTWVIDQMVRALTGGEYEEFVAAAKAGKDGPETYAWDEGIAP